MCEHVVGDDEVGETPPRDEAVGHLASEEAHLGGNPRGDGDFGHVRRWLDAECGDAASDDTLQQVAVVARDLHDEARLVQAKAIDRALDEPLGVPDPGVRVRGEVRVVAEDLLGCDDVVHLHEEAARAEAGVERVGALVGDGVLGQVRVAERLEPEVDDRVLEGRAARAAQGRRAHWSTRAR